MQPELYKWKYPGKLFITISQANNIRFHRHDFFELVYVLKGKVLHHFNDAETVLSEGDYFVMDTTGGHGYQLYGNEPFRIINCLFRAEFLDSALEGSGRMEELTAHYLLHFNTEQLFARPTEIIFHDDGSVLPLFKQMLNEYLAQKPGFLEVIRGCLIVLIVSIMRQTCAANQTCIIREPTRSIIVYIEKHAAEHCTLEGAAAAVSYSPPYISHRFKLDTGMTFSAYLQNLRMANACRLLISTDLPVEAVANMVGYKDLKHFYRIFHRTKDTTPNAYRTERMKQE